MVLGQTAASYHGGPHAEVAAGGAFVTFETTLKVKPYGFVVDERAGAAKTADREMHGTFILDLHDLDAAGKPLRAPVTATFLRGAFEGLEVQPAGPDGELDIRYSRTGNDVVIHGTVRAELQVPCARCLEPVTFAADAELALLLVPAASQKAGHAKGRTGKRGEASGEQEMTADDAVLDTYEGDELNLDPFVREALLLEVPPFPLCSENCPGIAPPPQASGAEEKGIDPRLAPLLKLKSSN